MVKNLELHLLLTEKNEQNLGMGILRKGEKQSIITPIHGAETTPAETYLGVGIMTKRDFYQKKAISQEKR